MRDIDAIIAGVRALAPEVIAERLKVRHLGADDDGLWFFRHPHSPSEVQLESPHGLCPFQFESDAAPGVETATTINDAIEMVVRGLRIAVLTQCSGQGGLPADSSR